MIGQTIGHFEVVAKLGAGGMGEVYRARDPRLERDVAIKVLPAATLGDDIARTAFRQEALALARLNHPNIGMVFDFNTHAGVDVLVMELVEGETLAARIASRSFTEAEVAALGAQVASALQEAHDRGIIHRDLKPGNIVVTHKGQAKVLDFGLARLLRPQSGADLTATLTEPHVFAGTLPYMAPEQLRGQPADTRADIWALGVVLHEMASGTRPFTGQTGFELSSAILNQAPAPLPPRVRSALRGVIGRCLAKDRGQRYQRAAEVRAALEALQTGTASPWSAWRYHLVGRRMAVAASVLALGGLLVTALDIGGLRSRSSSTGQRIASLAVLPVENLTGDTAQDYFADGMTEELITELSRIRAFKKVAPRTSVIRYRAPNRPPSAEIARALGVDAVVEASLLQSRGQVRATFRLVDGATEQNLWADRYARNTSEVHALYGEVVGAIARELNLTLSPAEQARLATIRRVDPEAYAAYLNGMFHIGKLTPEAHDAALGYFQAALEKDPNYALGHAGIANIWLARAHMGFISPREALPHAEAAARKALELDDSAAEVHFIVASTKLYLEWDWAAAERGFVRAIDLNPNMPDVYLWYSDLLAVLGRRDEALAAIERGVALDPINFFFQASAAGRLLRLDRHDLAMTFLAKAIATEPNLELAHRYLWYAHHRKANYEDAFASAKRFFELKAQPEVADALARGYLEGGYPAAMRRGANRLAELAGQRYVQGTVIAGLYAFGGDHEQALDWLERAHAHRDSWLTFLRDDVRFVTLHSEPRFQQLLRRMKIPV